MAAPVTCGPPAPIELKMKGWGGAGGVTHLGPLCWGWRIGADGKVPGLTCGASGQGSLLRAHSQAPLWVPGAMVGLFLSPKRVLIRPPTWQLACCASISQRRHVAFGFVGSASPLGVLTRISPFLFLVFLNLLQITLKETRLRACPSSHPACF